MATGSVGTDVCGLTTPPSTYDQIGVGYTVGRRSDPGRSRAIENALDRAGSVINVGAGTGSYEPTNRRVVAVEPSEVMLGRGQTVPPRPSERWPSISPFLILRRTPGWPCSPSITGPIGVLGSMSCAAWHPFAWCSPMTRLADDLESGVVGP